MANISMPEVHTSGITQAAVDTNAENHFVLQFSSNVMHLAQQKMSRLRKTVSSESVNGESKRFDLYDAVDAKDKGNWNEAVVYQTTPQTSRWVTPRTSYRSELIDKFASLRMIHDPSSELTRSFAMTMGRELDYRVLEAAVSDAKAGKDGSSSVPVADVNRRVTLSAYGSVDSPTGLTFESLLVAKEYFFANESLSPDENLHCVLSGKDVVSLLQDEKLTSADYQSLQALVRADLSEVSLMGITFHRTELINNTEKIPSLVTTGALSVDIATGEVGVGANTLAAGARKVLFYTPRAIRLGIAEDIVTNIDTIPELFHSKQILSTMDCAAVRMSEKEYLEMLVGTVS